MEILNHVCMNSACHENPLVVLTSNFPWASQVKNLPANAGDVRDTGSVPGLRSSPGGGHGNPLPYSCLEKPMDRGASRAYQSIGLARVRHD